MAELTSPALSLAEGMTSGTRRLVLVAFAECVDHYFSVHPVTICYLKLSKFKDTLP